MPLLATLVGNISAALAALFSQVVGYRLALKLAAYTTWIALYAAFLASVFTCMSALWSTVSGIFGIGSISGGWLAFLGMGLGMFIPSNAASVMSCVASVWFATSIVKIQRRGIENFGS